MRRETDGWEHSSLLNAELACLEADVIVLYFKDVNMLIGFYSLWSKQLI